MHRAGDGGRLHLEDRGLRSVVEAPRSATVRVKSITEAIVATFERADRVLRACWIPSPCILSNGAGLYADSRMRARSWTAGRIRGETGASAA